MSGLKNKFTLKIIFSYLVIGALAFLMGWFLFSEVKTFSEESQSTGGDKKIIETGTLINLLYKNDGFSRLALLTENDEDFEEYLSRNDSLFAKIDEIKTLTTDDFQQKQLDSIKILLEEKNQNIEQLRILRLTNQKETSLDDIMAEVRKLEASVGLVSVESMIRDPSKLTRNERRIWQSYADYLNSDRTRDTSMVKSKVVDSMLIASRYIVAEAKKENSRIRKALMQKENELILNDLNISEKLREIIGSFDNEISRRNAFENQQRAALIERAGKILRYTGVIGMIIIVLFSYYILSDFFRAERFKKNLEKSKLYTERLLKNREQLISTVSHDLKTPLNTVSGYSQLFRNTPLTKKQEYYLSQIDSSSNFISHLVNDLLDFSKLEIGKVTLESIPFSLENIIRESGINIKQVHRDSNVELIIEITEDIKNTVFESDPLRIKQILNNLIGNAFKFTEEGYVKIEAKEILRESDKSVVEIIVSDTGIGISKEKQQYIFEEFAQAENDIYSRFGGSGLGLAISQKLITLLDGTLNVESEKGKGSSFICRFPLKRSGRHLKKPESFQKGLKALILDDDKATNTLLRELFKQMEIETIGFTSFSDLKNFIYAENPQFDFILTDIQMPVTDGFSVLQEFKSAAIPAYSGEKIIAMTGSREHSRAYFLEKGFDEIIRKPFTKLELQKLIGNIFPKQILNHKEKHPQASPLNAKEFKQFDLTLLNSFLDSPEAIQEVLKTFYTQTNDDMEALKQAIETLDIQTVKSISHRMSTMFKQLNAHQILPFLKRMESTKKSEDAQALREDFSRLDKNIREFQAELLPVIND